MDERRWVHGDGRRCREMPYTIDAVDGLLTGFFYWDKGADDVPDALRLCHREHGLHDDDE